VCAGRITRIFPGEPVDHALGRSRGGWTTKIHALVDERASPVTMLLSAGQVGDNSCWSVSAEDLISLQQMSIDMLSTKRRFRRGKIVYFLLGDLV
jgi:hypothetical protein